MKILNGICIYLQMKFKTGYIEVTLLVGHWLVAGWRWFVPIQCYKFDKHISYVIEIKLDVFH